MSMVHDIFKEILVRFIVTVIFICFVILIVVIIIKYINIGVMFSTWTEKLLYRL